MKVFRRSEARHPDPTGAMSLFDHLAELRMRIIRMALALPVASSVSTKTPDSVASPSAGVKRSFVMPVMKRRIGSVFSIPMTEL